MQDSGRKLDISSPCYSGGSQEGSSGWVSSSPTAEHGLSKGKWPCSSPKRFMSGVFLRVSISLLFFFFGGGGLF